ncbi:hypothetical protein [Alicyclobacillus sp. ALC3]|uniref:hypothetical protein n=1 Tax=Alicyclobacillus sp. ALC3 TaxID=2796143 RepID=UPI0023799183|nr:hypothetical protein [Alicyclobacillus sp. ALC3]WDL97193.1 hypothetical protein JC200_00045 [Alicyclobacillus sp. ALC3]
MTDVEDSKPAESAVTEDGALDDTEPVMEETVNPTIEELTNSAEDWVNQLPETLQDEP